MNWHEVTEIEGTTLYVNFDHVVSITPEKWQDPSAQLRDGALLTTLMPVKATIRVREPASEVYGWLLPAKAPSHPG